MSLPDVHKKRTKHKLGIQKVGIRQVRLPFKVYEKEHLDRYGKKYSMVSNEQDTIADISIYCDLNKQVCGVNMSRFMTILTKKAESTVSTDFVREVLEEVQDELKSNNAYLKIRFPYSISKDSPVSELTGYIYHDCILEGKLVDGEHKFYLTATVQYIATCSCSKQLSIYLKNNRKKMGAPHMQRGYATIVVEFDDNEIVYIEDLASVVEKSIKSIPYPIVKRVDEMEIAHACWKNTHFVEEAARKIASKLNEDQRVLDWSVVVNHDESIHTHVATAIMYKGIKGGLR